MRLQFRDGDFAAVDDLEFMCAFNAGGTMTEPSDYDAAPPVPPAYGTWRRVRPDRFEAKYDYEAYDEAARPADGGSDATGRGVRLRF